MKKIYLFYSNHQIEFFNKINSNLKDQYDISTNDLDEIGEKDIYKNSIKQILTSDIVVAICDYPNVALGYSISLALEKYSKPVLVLYEDENKIDRLVLNIDHPMYTISRYQSVEDILKAIKSKESKHFKVSLQVDTCDSDICKI